MVFSTTLFYDFLRQLYNNFVDQKTTMVLWSKEALPNHNFRCPPSYNYIIAAFRLVLALIIYDDILFEGLLYKPNFIDNQAERNNALHISKEKGASLLLRRLFVQQSSSLSQCTIIKFALGG